MGAPAETQDITFETIGHCGVITLDRPAALNALTLAMVHAMSAALAGYAADATVRSVVVRSSSPRAFCAGGDIKTLYEWGCLGKHQEQMGFFAAEYRLCRQIARFPKPYVALIDGIVMGGGVGISVNGAYRLAGETYSLAMPEVGIGFFPDIGGTYFLPRLPGKAGSYLALTGTRIGLGDGVALGLATAHVPAARFAAILERLAQGEAIERVIAAEQAPAPDSPLMRQRHFVDGCFAAPTVDDILGEIDEASYAGSNFALTTYETIRSRSPTSLAIALKQMQIGASLDLDAALALEYRIAQRVVRGHDYYEGVRTVLIDRGAKPQWMPAEIDKVSGSAIEACFAAYPDDELSFAPLAGAA